MQPLLQHTYFGSQEYLTPRASGLPNQFRNLRAINNSGKIELDLPQLFVDECEQNPLLNEAFEIEPVYTGKNTKRYLLQIENPDDLRRIDPNLELLSKVDLGHS